jgi:hypothetical protein
MDTYLNHSLRWVCAFLEALPPVTDLEGKYVRGLCQVAARWKLQILLAKQDNISVVTDLARLPKRVAEKLPAFNSKVCDQSQVPLPTHCYKEMATRLLLSRMAIH